MQEVLLTLKLGKPLNVTPTRRKILQSPKKMRSVKQCDLIVICSWRNPPKNRADNAKKIREKNAVKKKHRLIVSITSRERKPTLSCFFLYFYFFFASLLRGGVPKWNTRWDVFYGYNKDQGTVTGKIFSFPWFYWVFFFHFPHAICRVTLSEELSISCFFSHGSGSEALFSQHRARKRIKAWRNVAYVTLN